MDMRGRTHIELHDLLDLRHYLDKIELFSSPLQHSALLGLHRSRLRGRGMDFDQVRAYQAGDDARSIDWRVTARTGEVHTKVFHEERERPTFILVEQSLHLFFATTGCFKSVLAAQAASLFAWASLQHNDRVGGLVFGDSHVTHTPAHRNKHSVLHFLHTIADANQRLQQPMTHPASNPLPEALQQARRLMRPGSLIILICNERHLNEESSQLLRRLAQHSELILLPLSDPLEHCLPKIGQARFNLGGDSVSINTNDSKVRQHWQEQGAAYTLAWQKLAQQLSAPLLPLSTQQPVLQQLQAISLQQSHSANARP
ncbi:MAG: DUF58 domain-containing protein [Pseudomonas sp.]|jgi:uncharacterized protein (DUF58 family)|nr:DUF58 domain-containing protein [Pseudomonas sp.]MDD2222302.1 DUF58 domain-containing protein [Pseudomonas sp.]MDY0414157.1 DUF58 domain-containing protein [Pseudomonas sp.]NLO54303.1 DUF58 domain-containing protein [Gammaproteobacteria bacterium]